MIRNNKFKFNSVYYVIPVFSEEPLYIVQVNNNMVKPYEKHLEKQNLILVPTATSEFYEYNEWPKFSIDNKQDF